MIPKNQTLKATYEDNATTTIQYVITNKCNLECSYCPKKFLYDQSNFDNIDTFIEELQSFYTNNNRNVEIYITGGEPLTDFPAVKYLLKKLSKLNFVTNIIIFSNGILLNPTMIKQLNILRAIVKFNFYLTIHPSSTSLSKVKYLNTITKFTKFFVSKIIILNRDYFQTFMDNIETYKDYTIQPNMITTEELSKLKEIEEQLTQVINLEKYFILDNIPYNIIDLYLETGFYFKGWTCSAGKSYLIYNRGKLYFCSSYYHKKEEIPGERLNDYLVKDTICENTRCSCEQSIFKTCNNRN